MKHIWRILSALLAAAMLLSLLPAAAFAAAEPRAEGVTIDVTDYGADPTGAKESSTAVIAALAAAKELPKETQKTIVFPRGEYHFYEDYSEVRELYVSNTLRWDERSYANKPIGILVEGMKNVTIDGGGSLFIYHGNVCTMAAIDSENVTFTNFSEDFASPEVVDVTVESHDGDNAAILFIPACYNYTISGTNINWQGEISPTTGQPYWSGNNGFLTYQQYLDTVTGRSVSDGKYPFSNVSSITKVDDTHIKVVYSNADSRPPVGQCCQMRHPNPRKTPGAFFWRSKNVTVSNANFYFLHGFGMVGQLSENITLDTVKCQPRPGTGRTSAGFADFVQMSSIAGKVTIRNCEFADPHDDPINIHGTFLEVTDITADRRRVVVRYQNHETWGFPQYYKGDTVDFTVQNTLAHVENLSRTVVGVVDPGEGLNLNGAQRSKDNENDMKTIIVELDEPLPENVNATSLVMENVTYTPEVLIENCRFTETPTRAILVTTHKPVVIRNNYFDRIRTASIFISCDAQGWYESGRTEDVLITGNTFVAQATANNDDQYGYSAIIMVWPTNPSNDPNYQIHKNLRIEDNDFYILDGMPSNKNIVSAKSVNGLAIKNNRFLRYTPNVSLTLAAGSTALAAGGTQSTSLTGNGVTFANQLFRLQACKQVVFEGNTYDDGLNLGVKLDETAITTNDNVTDRDGVLAIGGNNQLPAVGAVRYFSSDPAVATVDESGVVTGVSAGTADICAYRTAGGRTFESNHLTFTVTGTAAAKPNKINITSDKDAVDVGGTVNLTATVDPSSAGSVAWSVKPAAGGGAATITQAGVLTGSAPGVVEVTASLGGVTASKLVTVNTPKGLSDAWTVEEEVAENWSLDTATEKVTIQVQSGGDWETGPGGHNYFLTAAPTGDFEAIVKLDSKTCGNGSCWCEAGVVLYQDHDNYVSVVRKNNSGSPKLAVNSEYNRSATENVINDISDTVVYLKLTKSGTSYSGHYSTDGTNWNLIQTATNAFGNYKVGFMAINAGDSHGSVSSTLGDFKLIQNGTTTSVPLVSTNAAPTVSNIAAAAGSGAVDLTYDYSDTDKDAQDGSLIAWYVSDTQNGHYTRLENASSATLTVTAATSKKWVKAVVVPRDATGRYGAPAVSPAVQAPAQTAVQDDATLASLSVAGLALSPAFGPQTAAYTVNVPSSADKVTIAATATQAAATVAGTGEVTLTGTETAKEITVTAPNGTTIKTYTVTIHRAASSNATLSGLTATAGSVGISYNTSTRFYQLVADGSASTLALTATAADPGAKIEVRFNGVEKGEYASKMSLPLMAGLNNLELRVTAADGISTALYRVRVMKPASPEARLTALTVNGNAVDIPASGTDLGLVQVGDSAALNAAVSSGASVLISVDGKAAQNNTSVELAKTLSMATIRVVAEDGVTENVYTLALSKPDDTNAQLYSLKLGKLALSPAFDPAVTEYTATSYGFSRAALTATAAQTGAAVAYETVAEYKSGTGRVSGDCRFFKDEGLVNKVTVTVTSPDGEHTKTYTINVTVVESAYLSDLPWTSATSGWGSVQRDCDVDPSKGKLSLLENGQAVTYDKGLGTHANSVIEYDLSSWGFTTFTSKVGMDHSQASNTTQRLRFYVDLDGTNQYATPENQPLGSTMNCDAVNIDVAGAEQLTLRVIYTTGGDGNAHADWADAKLSSSIPLLSQTTDVSIQYVKFEHHDEHVIYVNANDPNHTVSLHPIFKPVGVTESAHEISLDWLSSDTKIATVSEGADKKGLVTAVAPGRVEISATADGGAEDSCFITVKQKVEGTPTISSPLKFGSRLTVDINEYEPEARPHLTYQWYRGANASGTVLSSEAAYIPVKEDIGSVLTVKVSCDPNSYYEGEAAFTTGVIEKADGFSMLETPTHRNVSANGKTDGAITGLFKGRSYQYLAWDSDDEPGEDAGWIDFCDDSAVEEPSEGQTHGTAEITGLGVGSYLVRRAGDDTHKPGPVSSTVQIVVRTPEMYDLTNPVNFDGGVVRASHTQIREGGTVTLTVSPSTGYQLVKGSLKAVAGDGTEYIAAETATAGTYTFSMPAANVTISAVFEKKTYTIGHSLTNITCSLGDAEHHTATHGTQFAITLTPDEGYTMPRALTLTETGTERRFTDYTYEVDPDDPAKRVLTFANGVTCNITISGAAVPKTYTVVYELTNGLTASGAPQTVTHGTELSVTLAAARGYSLPGSIAVTVGGADFDGFRYDPGTGTVEIAANQINGNVVITARGEARSVALQSAAIVGPAQVGRTLSVNTVPVQATVDYQWLLVDEDGTETLIDGAAGNRYVIPAEAEGKAIRVSVTGTGGYTGTVTSEPTAAVLPQSEPFVFVTAVTLEPGETSVAVGGTVRIGAAVTPDNATSGILYWFSGNDAIATVDQNGLVTGVAEGTVTITARSTDTVNFVTAECAVTVTAAATPEPAPAPVAPITGGGSDTSTTTNPDGTVTTTVTDKKTGTVTETTEKPDGTVETKETLKDGTVTETTIDAEGGKVEKVTSPEKDVAITVTDKDGEELAKVEIPNLIPEPETRFVDVPVGHWSDEAIHNMAALDVVRGVGNNTYNRNGDMKRGDLALMLSRMSSSEENSYELSFADVPAGKYYASGVAWAARTGVVTGRSADTFDPENTITREELAVMLYRYAKLLKLDSEASEDALDAFTDGGDTHGWAEEGMAWCVKNGILQGKGNGVLDPRTNVTRAEVAVMLQRFVDLLK